MRFFIFHVPKIADLLSNSGPPAAGILYRIRPFSSSAGAALAAWGSNMESSYCVIHGIFWQFG
jgi:hypothetical protein